MKHRQYPGIMFFAAAMITALLLISPVGGYVPPGGGGGGGGSGGSTSSGSSSSTGSGDCTWSSTASSGTYTSTESGLDQAVLKNNLPVSTVTIKVPASASGTPPAQLPTYTVSVMSDINTKQLIQSVQETPGQGAIINGGQIPKSSTTPPKGQGDTGATDTSKQNPAGNVKDSKKIVSKTGSGVKYDIKQDTYLKLEYNYEHETTKTPQYTESTPVKITSHTIKAGVGFRL